MDTIRVQLLDKSLSDHIKTKIEEIGRSVEIPKQLGLELDSTSGNLFFAVDIVRLSTELKVELLIKASGKLSSAGTVLAGAGKIGSRSAELQSVFVLNDADSEKLGRYKKVNNPNSGIMEYMLQRATSKRRGVKQALSSMNVISSFEAEQLGLVDTLIGFESMYAEELKPKSKIKSIAPAIQIENEVNA